MATFDYRSGHKFYIQVLDEKGIKYFHHQSTGCIQWSRNKEQATLMAYGRAYGISIGLKAKGYSVEIVLQDDGEKHTV